MIICYEILTYIVEYKLHDGVKTIRTHFDTEESACEFIHRHRSKFEFYRLLKVSDAILDE